MLKHNVFILTNIEVSYNAFFDSLKNHFDNIEIHFRKEELIKSIDSKLAKASMDDLGPLVFFVENPFLTDFSKYLDEAFKPLNYILVSFCNGSQLPVSNAKNVFEYLNTTETEQDICFLMNKLEAEINNKSKLSSLQFELMNFYEIGKSLSSEKDTIKLLDMIINSSMSLTYSDAGTIYLVVDKDTGNWASIKNNFYSDRLLKFIISKNMSINVQLETFSSPITSTSIFGYTAIAGRSVRIDDAYNAGSGLCYQHNHSFDFKTGYKTKSILSIPMKDHENNVIGVLQLMNKKKNKNEIIDYSDKNALENLISYDVTDDLIMNSLAGQAAVALENNLLYRDMNKLLVEYKHQNSKLSALSKKILKAHEDERKRVAREIHDGPAQSVVNLALKSELCKKYLQNKDYLKLAAEIDTICNNARSTSKEIRTIIYDLKPSHIEDGLIYSIKNRLDVFSESTGINVIFDTSGNDDKIEYYLSSTIYNIVQESLNNIQKHANAQNIKIVLSIKESEIYINIKDDGKGFDMLELGQRKLHRLEGGFGLEGMNERVELVGGKIETISSLGKGTRITVVIPL